MMGLNWPKREYSGGLLRTLQKVKLALCLISTMPWRHRGSGDIAPPFLTSAASVRCRFTAGERATGTHWIGGWVGPTIGLDTVEKRKTCTAGNWTRAIQPVARRYTELYGLSNAAMKLLDP
jgi:hypothetical protein